MVCRSSLYFRIQHLLFQFTKILLQTCYNVIFSFLFQVSPLNDVHFWLKAFLHVSLFLNIIKAFFEFKEILGQI